jgi:photosystem II stability/assembly factor-like uncharacterized protein
MVSRTNGWLALDRTTLYGSQDGGRTWLAAQGIDGVDGASEVSFTDAENGWAVANGLVGSIYQTTDGGAHWRLHDPLASSPSPG